MTALVFVVGEVLLASEFHPVFTSSDLMKLNNHDIYLKILISGRQSEPFSATTHPFPFIIDDKKSVSSKEECIEDN